MSGFTPEGLALREAADQAARAPSVLEAVQTAFSDVPRCYVWDLGAGTGASVRAFAEFLPREQHWTLVDHDPANLTAAGPALEAWAETSAQGDAALMLRKDGRQLFVRQRTADLSQLPAGVVPWDEDSPDLVTASALLDLTSAAWVEAFAEACASERSAVLATLTFDGQLDFSPAHEDDAAVRDAFSVHQRSDKGFGPALGPDATAALAAALEKRGYHVVTAESPWRLGGHDGQLLAALVEGIAEAVAETDRLPRSRLMAWRDQRMTRLESLVVGHEDLFAYLPA